MDQPNAASTVQAKGGTRAGVLISIIKGICTAQGVIQTEDVPLIERPFALHKEDFNDLSKAFIAHALTTSKGFHETYEDVRFTLITDTKAEGVLIGRHVESFPNTYSKFNPEGFNIERTIEGPWIATVPLV